MRKVLFTLMGLALIAAPAAAFHDGGVARTPATPPAITRWPPATVWPRTRP